MAENTPPPYEDITGISRVVMKDNAQETIENYNGNARPGEIVVNLEVDPPTLFVGNNSGFLTQIGTGNGGGSDYGNANVAAFLPVYNGNIEAVYIYADQIETFDIQAGNVTVANIVNQFPINITSNNYTWQFGGNILRAPEGGSWQSSAQTAYFNSPPDGYINLISRAGGNVVSELFMEHSFIRFFVDNGLPPKTWQMNLDGSFVIPGNIVGNTANNPGSLQWVGNSSGDNNGYTTLQLVPDATLFDNDQYLIIDPTEPSHIHIRAGGTQDASLAELYLGGELNYVRVVDDTGVRLQNRTRNDTFYSYSDPTDFNTSTWYESGGTFFVQYTTANAELINVSFQFNDDNENTLRVYYNAGANNAVLTSAGSVSNLGGGVYRVSVNEAPPANPTAITELEYEIWTSETNSVELQNDDFTVEVNDDIRITGNDTFSLRNRSNTDPITIRTDYDGNDYAWEFEANGTLNTPGDIVVNGDVTGTAGGSTLVIRAEPGSNTALQLNDIVDSEIRTVANLEIRTDVSNAAQVWTFDTVGTLTAPGNIAAGNIGLSGSITSVISVTDPTDFDNLTPINGGRAFVTNANLVAAGNFGAQVSGGGSNTVPVWSDGTNWYIG